MKRQSSTPVLLLAAAFALCVLRAACVQTGKPPNPVKPGQCPPERYVDPKLVRSNSTYCEHDGQCQTNKKCCKDNFDMICKVPAADRPGSCPAEDRKAERTTDFCTSDSECGGSSKCCFSNGQNTCFPFVKDKEGACEPNPIRCFIPGRNVCANDSGCQKDEKCCSFECGTDCRPPMKGFCPPNVLPPGIDATICNVDCGSCSETEMCCPYGCSLRCRQMSKERPGFCPFDPKMCMPAKSSCDGDLSCPDNMKCCEVDCERKCVPLLEEKPGTCPPVTTTCLAVTGSPTTPNCTSDYHCTGNLKCCTVKCAQTCTQPKLL